MASRARPRASSGSGLDLESLIQIEVTSEDASHPIELAFARVSAALGMGVEDYYLEGRRAWFRLHEKAGKRHEVPAHHNADASLRNSACATGQELDLGTNHFGIIVRVVAFS